MKKIILITRNDRVKQAFSGISKSPSFSLRIVSSGKNARQDPETFRYLDVSGMGPAELEEWMEAVAKIGCPWGILDPDGTIDDVAELFHRGACDYLPLKSAKNLKVGRIRQAFDFFSTGKKRDNGKEQPASKDGGCVSAPAEEYSLSWSNVKSGKKYSFCIMYAELLPSREVQGRSGAKYQEEIQSAFHNLISREAGLYNGKVWMWNDWGGLVLFPFDGQKYDTILMAMRLLLNRVPISIEAGPFNSVFDFRLALHIGATKYKDRGQTGTIVSDDINFIFHLGKNKLESGYLYLTDSFFPLVTDELKGLFKDQGLYEGHRIYRMGSPYEIHT